MWERIKAEEHPKTQDQILEIFKKVHGDHYDYSRVVYRGNENVKEIGVSQAWVLSSIRSQS